MSEDDVLKVLAALREQNAHLHDPVRFRHLEAMATRMPSQSAPVRQVLARRFEEAAAACRARIADAPCKVATSHAPAPAPSPLTRLNRHIAVERMKHMPAETWDGQTGSPSDMKSVRRFTETWSRIAAEQQLAKALTRGPEHAGPLNSHNLMLRAMSLMNGLSPACLRRFLAQADALLWLDHMNQQLALGKDAGKGARRARARK